MFPLPAESPPPQNAWAIAYGDLMALLLTLFVMIVAMSDLNTHDGRFQQLRSSLSARFGSGTLEPENHAAPRNVPLALELQTERARREAWLKSGEGPSTAEWDAPEGQEHPALEVYLANEAGPLSPEQQRKLAAAVQAWRARGDFIELRALVAGTTGANRSDYAARWSQAQVRTLALVGHLVETLRVEPDRLRLTIVPISANAPGAGSTGDPLPVQFFFHDKSPLLSTGQSPEGNLNLGSPSRTGVRR